MRERRGGVTAAKGQIHKKRERVGERGRTEGGEGGGGGERGAHSHRGV